MIIDSSALIAILQDEPEAAAFAHAISRAESCKLSGVNYVEAAIVADRQNHTRGADPFTTLLRESEIEISAVSIEQAYAARQAYMDFGKGYHPAGLNLGDCFAYALSKVTGEPLLFKGNDFTQTDIESAL